LALIRPKSSASCWGSHCFSRQHSQAGGSSSGWDHCRPAQLIGMEDATLGVNHVSEHHAPRRKGGRRTLIKLAAAWPTPPLPLRFRAANSHRFPIAGRLARAGAQALPFSVETLTSEIARKIDSVEALTRRKSVAFASDLKKSAAFSVRGSTRCGCGFSRRGM